MVWPASSTLQSPMADDFDGSSFWNKLLDIGGQAASGFVNKSMYGGDYAKQMAMAKEKADWAYLNGSGPADPEEYLADGRRGPKETRNAFGGTSNGMANWQTFALIGAMVLLLVLVVKKL